MNLLPSNKQTEVFNRVQSENRLTQCQGISQLYGLMKQSSSNQNEVKKLVGKAIEMLPTLRSKNACICLLGMLVKCAQEGLLDYDYLINMFLGCINAKVNNSVYCIESITKLILAFRVEFPKKYSIRNPAHPFIDMMRNSTDVEQVYSSVMHQIESIYANETIDTDTATLLVKPVIIYMFLQQSMFKHELAILLINKLSGEFNSTLIQLIRTYFSSLKGSDLKSVHLVKSIDLVLDLYHRDKTLLNQIVTVVEIVELLIKLDERTGANCSSQWKQIKKLAEQYQELINRNFLMTLAECFTKIGFNNLNLFGELVFKSISVYSKESKIDLAVFLPSLISHAMLFGSLETIEAFNTERDLVAKLIELIQVKLDGSELAHVSPNLSCTDLFNENEYHDLSSGGDKQLNISKLNLLSGYFILEEHNLDLVQQAMILFKQLISIYPSYFNMIFAIQLYKLKKSCDFKISNYLLNSLTYLIVPKVDVSVCLNVVVSLMSSSDKNENALLRSLCIKQMTKLCTMKFDYLAYEYLGKELTVTGKNVGFLPDKYKLEFLYTIAFCIHEIVSYRPDYYAPELLSSISNILNLCSTQANDDGVCAICIDTLSVLCESEVVDMKSTWQALMTQFKNEKRPLVLSAYARFFAVAAKLKHLNSSESQESFYFLMIQYLWQLTNENSEIQNYTIVQCSAFQALSKFERTDFKISLLPELIQTKLKERNSKLLSLEENKEKSLDDLFPQMPASCFIDILNSVPLLAYQGLQELFGEYLKIEIDAMPRRSISSAKEKIYSKDDQELIYRDFYDLIKANLNTQTEFDLNRSPDHTTDLTYLLFCYDAPASRNSENKVVKRQLASYWNHYQKTMRLIISKPAVQEMKQNLKLYRKAVLNFIRNAYKACILNLGNDAEERKASNEEKRWNWKKALDLCLECLNSSVDESHKPNEDESNKRLIILGALVEVTTEYLLENYSQDEEMTFTYRKWLEVLIDFVLNIKENKSTTTINEYISSFNYNKYCSTDTLKFLYLVYQNSTIVEYFLATCQPCCVRINIAKFLLQYIDRIQLEIIESGEKADINSSASQVYMKNLISIVSSKEFDQATNVRINSLIRKLLDRYIKLNTGREADQLLLTLVDSLFSLYNEESVYYDELDLLETLLKTLDTQVKNIPQSDLSSSPTIISSFVYLTCLAYKSNLISNEGLTSVYDVLNKDVKYNQLIAFFCRFTLSFGFADSIKWLETLYKKWMRFYSDFKMNLESDVGSLVLSMQGVFCLLSGVHVDEFILEQKTALPMDIEKLMKPEQTIKDMLKYIGQKGNESLAGQLRTNLSYMLFRFNQTDRDEVYSTSNSYDYLDEFSLLRELTNDLTRVSKETTETNQLRFDLIANSLLTGCKNSQAKQLPPINFYYFMTSLIKSKYGAKMESELVELTLMQVSHLNSAYSLIKNYLVDTNYFTLLKESTQRIILNRIDIVLSRFDVHLIEKLFRKLKLFFSKLTSPDLSMFSALLSGVLAYVSAKESLDSRVRAELGHLIKHVFDRAEIDVNKETDVQVLDKIVQVLLVLDDKRQQDEFTSFHDTVVLENKFFAIFYLKLQFWSRLDLQIASINNSIRLILEQADLFTEETRFTFFNLFGNFLLTLNASEAAIKSVNIKNLTFNWLVEYMELIKSLLNEKSPNMKVIEFGISVFALFIYCWLNTRQHSTSRRVHIGIDNILARFDSNIEKLLLDSYWKQLTLKLVDWLIYLLNENLAWSREYESFLKKTLMRLFSLHDLPADIWYKISNYIIKQN